MTALIIIIAFTVSCGLTWLLARPDAKLRILDHPNQRSLHDEPIPRTGGIAILAGIILSGLLALYLYEIGAMLPWLIGGMLIISLVSYMDDRHTLSVGKRLAVHVLAALLLVYGVMDGLLDHLPDIFGISSTGESRGIIAYGLIVPLMLLAVVWMTNLYNFMDGMDGLAGGMALIGFAAFGILGMFAQATIFTVLCWSITAAAAGFLVWNFPPAKIFMGDSGSVTLGYLVAGFSLWGVSEHIFPLWLAVLVFSPFIVDASATLIRRIIRGENIQEAHRTHYYQKLVQMGWGHKKTVIWEYILMIACSTSAIIVFKLGDTVLQYGLLSIWVLIYIVIMVSIRRSVDLYNKATKSHVFK